MTKNAVRLMTITLGVLSASLLMMTSAQAQAQDKNSIMFAPVVSSAMGNTVPYLLFHERATSPNEKLQTFTIPRVFSGNSDPAQYPYSFLAPVRTSAESFCRLFDLELVNFSSKSKATTGSVELDQDGVITKTNGHQKKYPNQQEASAPRFSIIDSVTCSK